MARVLAQLLLLAVQTDSVGELVEGTWITRCLHCRSKLWLSEAGVPLNGATLEHVVPQSWFDKRAATDLIADLSGPNDERNLALSCARCNQSKGSRHDAKGPANARAREVVTQLKETRLARYRSLNDASSSSEQ